MAPELLLPTKFGLSKAVPSKEADIYALGMAIYQVLTGKRPFLQRRKARIICAVILGERPAKPENAEKIWVTEFVWNLLVECWMEDRTMRPNASDTLRRLDVSSISPARFFRNWQHHPLLWITNKAHERTGDAKCHLRNNVEFSSGKSFRMYQCSQPPSEHGGGEKIPLETRGGKRICVDRII